MSVVQATGSTYQLSRIRRVIAGRMQESLASTAQLTCVVDADFTAVMEARRRIGDEFKAAHGVGLSPLAVVCRAVVQALAEHPLLNSSMDVGSGTVTEHGSVNLGIAVDSPTGLLVPNIKDAGSLDIPGLAHAIKNVADRSRNRRLRPDDLEGGTFTVTNTGSRGSLIDTPILNTPESAILAVGVVQRRPVAIGPVGAEQVVVRDRSYLCLTYDHRLIDGADAARFLATVMAAVEDEALVARAELLPSDSQ